jgi:hypothetical protein
MAKKKKVSRKASARGARAKAVRRRKPGAGGRAAARKATAKPRRPARATKTPAPSRSKATPASARRFVAAVPLPEAKRGAAPGEATELVLDQAKQQAAVVGSDIVAFVSGVTPERRQDIIHSSLFAQLVAKKKVGGAAEVDAKAWYDAYFDALTNIGWVTQERTFAEYREASTDFEAHEAISKVAATVLGPATTALAVVESTLGALRTMGSGQPWITLFDRESRTGKTAHFQVTLVEQEPEGKFLVSLMAFSLEATSTLTQVLFFRVRRNEATLRHCSGHVTIDTDVLEAVRPTLKARLAAWALEFVREVPLPEGP